MSRELRRVPANWKHPKDRRGHFRPLHDEFTRRRVEWDEEAAQWAKGFVCGYGKNEGAWLPHDADHAKMTIDEWIGARPEPFDYMPDWPEAERTHFQMYETTTEGTPISPVFATIEELARWLADTGASAFGGDTAGYEAWLATCKSGWAGSAFIIPGRGLISGVEMNREATAPPNPQP